MWQLLTEKDCEFLQLWVLNTWPTGTFSLLIGISLIPYLIHILNRAVYGIGKHSTLNDTLLFLDAINCVYILVSKIPSKDIKIVHLPAISITAYNWDHFLRYSPSQYHLHSYCGTSIH